MKKNLLQVVAFALCCLLGTGGIYAQTQTEVLAFPGAEGFGKYAVGGRNGSVYRVTNLNDSGSGSLRDALSQGNRIIIFEVAGVIKVNSPLVCKSNTYIAGQTAPGEGITIYGDGFSFSGASNSICRYIRVRAGKGASREDALGLGNGQDIIFDHVSVSWGNDETFSITSDGKGGGSHRITIQNSIISQGLLPHSAGGLCQPDGSITIYRTLFADNDTRNLKMKTTSQYVNNIVYNWKSAAYIMGGNSAGTFQADAIGNYFIVGPGGGKRAFSGANSKYNLYSQDNLVDANQNGVLDGASIPTSDYEGGPTFASKAYYPTLPTVPAAELFDNLLPTVGASLPYRDDADWYVLDEVRSLGRLGEYLSNENELPIGIPTTWNLWAGEARTDTDNDGIPDDWELIIGSNPNLNDAMVKQAGKGGYANIELYINAITAENSQPYLKAPIYLKTASVTQNEITLQWLDVTDLEDGYIIEEKKDGAFVTIATVGKNVITYELSGLEPETTHTFRVKAYNATTTTEASKELTVKTKPIPVSVVDPNTYVPDAIWTGTESGTWDMTTANWNTGAFADKQNVLFDETGSGGTVTVSSEVKAGTVFVKGDKDYTFSGVLAGEGSLNKTGTGKLTLPAGNTYTGATVLWGGVMEISKLANGGTASSIGASQNYDFNWVWNGGTIRYTGASVSTNRNAILADATVFEVANSAARVTFTGNISGEGDFIKTGPGSVYGSFSQHSYTGSTIVREGTYELNGKKETVKINHLILEGGRFKTSGGADGEDGIYTFPITVRGDKTSYFEPTRNSDIKSKVSGTGNLQIDVTYVREIYSGNWNEYYGNLTVNGKGQEFMLYSSIPNARVILNDGAMKGKNAATIYLGALSGNEAGILSCSHVKTDGATVTWVVGGLDTDEEFKGVINSGVTHATRKGRSNIVKEGEGYWRLTGANKYLGTTTVKGGMLIVNGSHTGDKDVTTPVTPGAYYVESGGTLAGKGNITASSLTVKDGGILAPGDNDTGTLTVNNAVNLQKGSTLRIAVNRKAKTAVKLAVSGNKLTLAGDLELQLVDGQYAIGDSFTVMTAGSYSGTFANIYPERPGNGLSWDTSSLYTTGLMKVVEGPTGIPSYEDDSEVVRTLPGTIVIEDLSSSKQVSVYNVSGTPVFNQEVAEGSCSIPTQSGVYLVKVGDKVRKVIVQ
ncbi:autotransporter-associated beta strand repeat-containing protein [Bacteroidales bacterium OttesenSCG-928-L03]|nr:autotransporter-associated beta strand repeat-containing protein [Bacteroidales bacterium OttesenSCG-928-L03]